MAKESQEKGWRKKTIAPQHKNGLFKVGNVVPYGIYKVKLHGLGRMTYAEVKKGKVKVMIMGEGVPRTVNQMTFLKKLT